MVVSQNWVGSLSKKKNKNWAGSLFRSNGSGSWTHRAHVAKAKKSLLVIHDSESYQLSMETFRKRHANLIASTRAVLFCDCNKLFFFFNVQEILFKRQIELQRGNKSLFLNDKLKTGRAKAYIKRTKNIIHKRPLS